MKKFLYVFYNILIILNLIGCNTTRDETRLNNVKGPKIQIQFDSIHRIATANQFKAVDSVSEDNVLYKFDLDLWIFLREHKLFVNWEGNVKTISFKDRNNKTYIRTIINYVPDSTREVLFWFEDIIPSENISSDSMYQKLKRIPVNSKVYFDGFISRDFKNRIQRKFDNKLSIAYQPNYEFNLIDISTSPKRDTLPKFLNSLVDINFKVFELLRHRVNNKISEAEWKFEIQKIIPKGLEDSLSIEQNDYNKRLIMALYKDFCK